MNKFQQKFNKLELRITEEEVIEMLSFKNKVMEEYDIRELLHLVTPDLEIEKFFEIKGAYVGNMILREE